MSDTTNAHLEWCRFRNLRPNTIRARAGYLRRVESALGPVEHITTPQFVDWWSSRHVGPAARATELAHLRSYYRWSILTGLRVTDPTMTLPIPRIEHRQPVPISEADLARALDVAAAPVADWLLLAAYAGFRCHEIAGFRGEHYDRIAQLLRVVDGKGGKDRPVPVHPRIVHAAAAWPAAGPIWLDRFGRPFRSNSVTQRGNQHLRDQGTGSTMHKLRARFATQAYAASHDIRAIQELLGHASLVTTQRYVAVNADAGRAAVLALP